MATKAVKHFRLRQLARAPPPPSVLKQATSSSTGSPFDFARFEFSQPAPVASASNFPKRANPFIPSKNPKTGRWSPPKYSLRQQADLVKKARASGTLALLPPAPKTSAAHLAAISFSKAQPASQKPQLETQVESDANSSLDERWSQPVEWVGEVKEHKVAGAEIGNRLYAGKKRMFKGHKWERVAEKRALKRRMLMRDMEKRIQRYKQASAFFSSPRRALTASSPQYHKRRRPNPLKPSKTSGGKLPF